ncbi:MAG: hypothetical protein U0441_21440 [Polyangiaceae bacterium]
MPAGLEDNSFWGGREKSFLRWLQAVWAQKPTEGLRWDRRLLFWALYGVVMGTVFDSIHVHTRTAYYGHTPLIPVFDVAWYVPIEFTCAGVLIGMLRPEVDEEFKREMSRLSGKSVLFGLGCFWFAWGFTALCTPFCWGPGGAVLPSAPCTSHPNHMLFFVLSVIAVGTWWAYDKTLESILLASGITAIGVGLEMYLVNWPLPGGRHPTYHYAHADFWGVPCWLPLIYVIAAGSLGNLARFLKYPDVRPNGSREGVSEEPISSQNAA